MFNVPHPVGRYFLAGTSCQPIDRPEGKLIGQRARLDVKRCGLRMLFASGARFQAGTSSIHQRWNPERM